MKKRLFHRPVIGLALGGGGVRGLSQIGVLKVLEEERIPIDCLAGSSAGGLIAALFASGITGRELEEFAMDISKTRNLFRMIDVTTPHRGLLKGERVRDYVAQLLNGATTFADLHIPLALTATDLISCRTVVFKEGPLLPAIMATVAFPGVFPPVAIGNQRLVDGGVLDNVPADVVRELGAEEVVAVDVGTSPQDIPLDADGHGHPFYAHLLPDFAMDFYRIELMMSEAITQARLDKAAPRLILRPAVSTEVTIFTGIQRAKEIIFAGEVAAHAVLPALHKISAPRLHWPW